MLDDDGGIFFLDDIFEDDEDLLFPNGIMLQLLLGHTINYAKLIYTRICDEDIDFTKPPLRIQDLNESTAISDFRFRKDQLTELVQRLYPKMLPYLDGDEESIKCINKYKIPFETGILMLLYRLAHACRIRPEMEKYFSTRKSKVSSILHTFMNALTEVTVGFFDNPGIFFHRFDLYMDAVKKKADLPVGSILRVWGFIDGTLRRTCRPKEFQRMAYSGHKRCHGIKFQSVITPDGLIACLYGPIPGSRHDSFMLTESRLLDKLRAIIPEDLEIGDTYSLYGDPAYPQSSYLFGAFPNAPQNSDEARFNAKMSSVRQCVEWGFKEISTLWPIVDFKRQMKIFKVPVAKYYIVAAFFTNCHCCFNGNETSKYFGLHDDSGRLSLAQYLALA